MNIKDLTGKKFGNLTVLSLSSVGKHGKEYLCQCTCGNKKIFRGSTLTSGKIIGCGCNIGKNNKGKLRTNKIKVHIGEKYNSLTIIDYCIDNRRNQRGYRCVCLCDCGNKTIQSYADLKNGKVVSCGCVGKEKQSITGSFIGKENYHNGYHWYFIQKDKRVHCRSGFEVIYANYLMDRNISFLYEPQTFVLSKAQRYTPDFYLVKENKWIEIKGSFNNGKNFHQQNKIAMFEKSHDIEVLFWEDLVQHCNLAFKAYSTYIRAGRNSGLSVEDYFAFKIYNQRKRNVTQSQIS